MGAHTYQLNALRDNKLHEHLELVAEEWNEPDKWEANQNAVIPYGAVNTVVSPLKMIWEGDSRYIGSVTECIVVATYLGDKLIATCVFDDAGDLKYADATVEKDLTS